MQKLYLDIGQTFGRWTVIGPAPTRKRGLYWRCTCSCGNIGEVQGHKLRKGETLSCGCLKAEMIGNRARTHGGSGTRLYRIYKGMRNRCENPRLPVYRYYGGKGVRVCPEWGTYEAFAEWARNSGYADNLTIERIEVNENYCPENCTWISIQEQARNRTNNVKISANGVLMCVSDAARAYGLDPKMVALRRSRGWPESRWFETPRRTRPYVD